MGQAINADHGQIFLLPPSIEDWVPSNHPVRFIREFVSQLNLRKLGFVTKADGHVGTDFYGEELLLSVWMYGYFERIRSSRKLEKALCSDLALIWLAGTHRPDHSSLWRFWASNKKALRNVFKETVLVADRLEMIDFTLMAVDGTKLLAKGSRRSMWNEKSLSQKEKALDAAITKLEKAIGADTSPCADPSIPVDLANKQKLREQIKVKRAELKAKGRKNMHPLEPEARVMKNQRTYDLGYNAQAVADSKHQIVTAAEVTTDENDQNQLVPMIDLVVENLGRAPEETLADTGYVCEEQFGLAETKEYNVLTVVKKSQKDGKNPFSSGLFHYDPATETVQCPINGTLLKLEREKKSSRTGVMFKIFRCTNKECPLRSVCSKQKRGKCVEIGPNRLARQSQSAKQKLPTSKQKIKERAGIIEPIFAFTKIHGRFKRFTFAGLEGAQTQWAVEMASHNLRKIFQQWTKKGIKKAI